MRIYGVALLEDLVTKPDILRRGSQQFWKIHIRNPGPRHPAFNTDGPCLYCTRLCSVMAGI